MHKFRDLLSPTGDAACAHAVHLREQHNRAAILKAALEPFEFILVVHLHRTRQVRCNLLASIYAEAIGHHTVSVSPPL
jgi:hypothetical protein